jgi:hypothetical protein
MKITIEGNLTDVTAVMHLFNLRADGPTDLTNEAVDKYVGLVDKYDDLVDRYLLTKEEAAAGKE